MMDLGKAEDWNAFATRINALWKIRGADPNTKIHLTESGGTVAMSGGYSGPGLDGLDPQIDDFIHVGTGEFHEPHIFGNQFYGPQMIQNWNGSGYVRPNLVGNWNWWYPDGTFDYTWRLRLRMDFPFKITRLELYQVERVGTGIPFWNTGQAWSTDNPITPFAHQPGENAFVDKDGEFNVFPLKVYSGGSYLGTGSEMNTDYEAVLSSTRFDEDTVHSFYLHGDAVDVVGIDQFFRVMVFVTHADTGSSFNVVRGTISSAPVDPPTENG